MMSDEVIKTPKKRSGFNGQPGPGRPKGMPNKSTTAIKEMLLASLDSVGGQDYFKRQAEENPNAYMSLIGKIIPSEVKNQITGSDGGPIQHAVKVKFGD
jgi:hypothetical protein